MCSLRNIILTVFVSFVISPPIPSDITGKYGELFISTYCLSNVHVQIRYNESQSREMKKIITVASGICL